ncbi:MAG: hypothetical protein JWP97_3824 [Labilithrix sp.]|nr:hypothetical protein [Labilithrix sp.]
MVKRKLTFVFASVILAAAAFQVGCGDDDGHDSPDTGTADTGTPDTGPGVDGGTCKFNDFVTRLIDNSTTATALPSTDLGEKCTDDQTPFPASMFAP